MTSREIFSERVRERRAALGMRPEEVAFKTGCSVAALYKWESGKPMETPLVPWLARALGVTTDYLFGMDIPTHDPERSRCGPRRGQRGAREEMPA